MAKVSLVGGTTSYIAQVFIQDSSSTVGAGKTGLAFNTAGLTAYYARPGAVATVINLVTQTVTGAFSSGGFVEIDSVNMPGFYRLDVPNAVLAAGALTAAVCLKGAANMAELPIEFELTAWNNQDAVRGGLSALPNAAAGANGGLPLGNAAGRVDVGNWIGNAVTVDANNAPNVSAKYWAGTLIAASSIPVGTASGAAGGLFIAGANAATTVASFTITGAMSINGTGNVSQTGDSFARIGAAGVGLTAVGLAAAQAFNNTGTWTGNLTGSVGSVTGNVGGNVVGSVGSVAGLNAGLLDVAVSTRLSTASYAASIPVNFSLLAIDGVGDVTYNNAAPPAAATIAGAVWDVTLAAHLTPGSTGFALNAAGAAGDPWSTTLPGAYVAGTAGYIVGVMVPEVWKLDGLDTANQLTVSAVQRKAGAVVQTITSAGGTTTVKRT